MPATRFVTDASLEYLARRMRFAGFDVITHRGARLEELFEIAAREQRIVLTTSARHPKRWRDVPARRVDRGDFAAALRALADAYEPAGAPFTRCPDCNQVLHRRTSFEAVGEVPGRVMRAGGPLSWCPACGKWFWVGSHVERIRAWLESALGHPLPPTERPGGDHPSNP